MFRRLFLGFAAALIILMVGNHYFPHDAKQRAREAAAAAASFKGSNEYDRQTGGVEVSFKVLRDWGTGMEARFALKNTGAKTLHDWTLFVDFPRAIHSIQGAQVT